MRRSRVNPWLRVGSAAVSLGTAAAQVIALRTMAAGAGGKTAKREARRMVDEKVKAALALQALALAGSLGRTPHGAAAKAISHYRKAVRANRRRLLKKPGAAK